MHAIFPNAVAQGQVAAQNVLGHGIPYEGADRMNSLKHLGVPVMAVGYAEGDKVLRRRWRDNLRTLYLQDGRLVGFQLAGDISAAGVLRSLLNKQEDVRPLLARRRRGHHLHLLLSLPNRGSGSPVMGSVSSPANGRSCAWAGTPAGARPSRCHSSAQ